MSGATDVALAAPSLVERPPALQFPADPHEIVVTLSPVPLVPGTFVAVPQVPPVSLTNGAVTSALA